MNKSYFAYRNKRRYAPVLTTLHFARPKNALKLNPLNLKLSKHDNTFI